jgi:hypothetical protein
VSFVISASLRLHPAAAWGVAPPGMTRRLFPLPQSDVIFCAYSRIAQNILRGFVFYAIFMPILVFFMNFPGKSLFFSKILLILTQITKIHT